MSGVFFPEPAVALVRGLLSPYVTGPLLWALTAAPDAVREATVARIQQLPVQLNLERTVLVLKWLVGLGVASRVNAWLGALALNSYRLSSQKSKWDWSKEVVVITGGSSGIGACMVREFQKKGSKVAVVDVQGLPESLKLPGVHFFQADITNPDVVNATAKAVQDKLGVVSVLINNAGIGTGKTILSATPQYVQKIFGVNVMAHFFTVQAFLPAMIKQKKGHIVTIASTASFVSLPGIADYAATKAGALSFHEALRLELKHSYKAPEILTTIVHPNWTRTPLIAEHADDIEKKQGPLLTAEDVARQTVDRITSGRSSQLIIPAKLNAVSTIKGWPHFFQEGLRDILGSQAAKTLPPTTI